MARYKYFYNSYCRQDGRYWHFGIRIFKNTHYGDKQELATLEWQGSEGNAHWYGGAIIPHNFMYPEQLFTLGSVLTTLLGRKDTGVYGNPEFVLQCMREKGWTEVIYDARVDTYVPLSEVMPSSFHKWADSEHTASVVAETADEARVLLHAKMDEYGYVETKERWIAAGETVDILFTGTRVDKTTVQETMESPYWYKRLEDRS
jgi:hypothetical protein